jgi:hypothetical protein
LLQALFICFQLSLGFTFPYKKMEGRGEDNDLISFSDFSNLASDSDNLNFRDDIRATVQGEPLQNDVSLENRNLIENPNPSLLNTNPSQNQGQLQVLSSPFRNMHLSPNSNNFNEPELQPPHYQLNAGQLTSLNHLPSYRNQYTMRPPYQPSSIVASSSRGVTDISSSSRKRGGSLLSIRSQPYGITMNHSSSSGIVSSASDPMQHSMEGFVRNTRMRVDPCQERSGVVADSPNAAQYNMGYPRPNPNSGQPLTNCAPASNALSIPLVRPNYNPGHPMANRALASNTLSIPLARPNPNLGHPMTNHAVTSKTHLIPLARPNSNNGHQMANRALASNALSIPLARPNLSTGHQMANPAPASNTLSSPLASGVFFPRVGTNMSRRQVRPVISTARAPMPEEGVTCQSQYRVNEAIPAELLYSHHQHSRMEASSQRTNRQPIRAVTSSAAYQISGQGASIHQGVPAPSVSSASSVFVPCHVASQNRSPVASIHQGVPASSVSSLSSVIIPSQTASQIRSQGASIHQVVPAIPSVPALSASSVFVPGHTASQIRSQGASIHQTVPASSTLSVLIEGYTVSAFQIGNHRAVIVPERPSFPRTRLPGVWVQVPNSMVN